MRLMIDRCCWAIRIRAEKPSLKIRHSTGHYSALGKMRPHSLSARLKQKAAGEKWGCDQRASQYKRLTRHMYTRPKTERALFAATVLAIFPRVGALCACQMGVASFGDALDDLTIGRAMF